MSSKDKKEKKPGLFSRMFSGGDKKKEDKHHKEEKKKEEKKKEEKQRKKSESEKEAANGEGARPKEKSKPAKAKPEKPQKGGKRRRKRNLGEVPPVDTSKPIRFPCTPEIILEYHKKKTMLTPNEEWLVVELNEFECLVDTLEVIQEIAKHSKMFEVEPPELWEEFFENVDDIPSYDEVINYDIWQEFRYKQYQC